MTDPGNSIGGPSDPAGSRSISSSLLDLVRSHDNAAWERLVRLYEPLVYSWSRKEGVSAEDAADVVQEVFRAVWRRVAEFHRDREGDTFRGWLWTITRNKVHDHFRSRGLQPAVIGGTDLYRRLQEVPEPVSQSTHALVAGDELGGLLHRAMELIRGEFEERTWQAFWRLTIDGQPAADIGRDLGMNPSAVRQAKYRILRRLRQEMGELSE
jgi:RNA polymerase sigma-70 factor, ECF subfamily